MLDDELPLLLVEPLVAPDDDDDEGPDDINERL
jgi:hypothetical protein